MGMDIEELLDDPRFIIRVVALFCASTALSGANSQSQTFIKMAGKFEEYLMNGEVTT